MHRTAGTTIAPIRGRPAARDTWHLPPREGLQKDVDAPTGQTGGTPDPETGRSHVHYPNLCAFVLVGGVGCRLHAPGEENFFDMGSSGLRKL